MAIKTEYCMWELFSDVMHVPHDETSAEVILIGQVFPQIFLHPTHINKELHSFSLLLKSANILSINTGTHGVKLVRNK